MVPDDPLGRSGPRLEEFLRKEVFLRYLFPFPDCLVFTNLFQLFVLQVQVHSLPEYYKWYFILKTSRKFSAGEIQVECLPETKSSFVVHLVLIPEERMESQTFCRPKKTEQILLVVIY